MIAYRRMLHVSVLLALPILIGLNGCSSNAISRPAQKQTCHIDAADLASGAGGRSIPTQFSAAGLLTIDGSTALQPLFSDAAQTLVHTFGSSIVVNGGGSGQGLKDVESGTVQIGMSDFFAKEKATATQSYQDLVDHQVAAVPFTMVISPDIKDVITNLSTSQIYGIYTGKFTDWSQVGGPHESITVVLRQAGSGTRFSFQKYVLGDTTISDAPTGAITADSTTDLIAAVGNHSGAIGYASTNFVTNAVAVNTLYPICIDGYGTNVSNGTYRFWAYEHAYTKGEATGMAKAFLDVVTSASFQEQDIPALVFLRVNDLSDRAKATHPQP
jgi:phosphate transport system substrate-binding protein